MFCHPELAKDLRADSPGSDVVLCAEIPSQAQDRLFAALRMTDRLRAGVEPLLSESGEDRGRDDVPLTG